MSSSPHQMMTSTLDPHRLQCGFTPLEKDYRRSLTGGSPTASSLAAGCLQPSEDHIAGYREGGRTMFWPPDPEEQSGLIRLTEKIASHELKYCEILF